MLSDSNKKDLLMQLDDTRSYVSTMLTYAQAEAVSRKNVGDFAAQADAEQAAAALSTALRDLSIEIEELRIRMMLDWLSDYGTLAGQIDKESAKIKGYAASIASAADKAQTAAQVLAAVFEIIKFIAPIV